jgi:hypothetical protein
MIAVQINNDMRVFGRRALGFSVVLVVVFLLVNLGYYQMVLSNTVLERSYEDFFGSFEGVRVLFMGDSHPKRDVNPELIPGSFNFADVGENYIQTFYKLRGVLAFPGVEVEYVVFPIDLHSFSSMRRDQLKNAWYWNRFISYSEVVAEDSDQSFVDVVVWQLKSWFPVISHGEELISYAVMQENVSELYKGYMVSYADYSEVLDKKSWALFRAQSQLEGFVVFDPLLVEYFRKCLILCVENNVVPVVVRYPVSCEYFTAAKLYISDVSEFYGYINSVLVEFPEVVVFDYQQVFFEQGDLFMDVDHLNKKGAEFLSQMLLNDLKSIDVYG